MADAEALQKAIKGLNEAAQELADATANNKGTENAVKGAKAVIREQQAELDRLLKKMNDPETSRDEKAALRKQIRQLEKSIESKREELPGIELEAEIQAKKLGWAKDDFKAALEKFQKTLAEFASP